MTTKTYLFYVLTSDIAPNEIRYVGVTTKKSVSQRLIQHRYCANHPKKRGLPVHKWMYSVYKQGGTINITEIDRCLENEWEEKEQFLIQKYKNENHNLLNIDKGGRGVITKEKRSIDSVIRSIEAHKKPITAYYLNGEIYKTFSSITEAANELKGKVNNICSVLNNHTKSAYGYMWKFKSNNEKIDPYQKKLIGTKIYQFDLNGKLLHEFNSKQEVLKFFNIKGHQPLNRALENKTHYKKFYWSYTPTINIKEFEFPYKYKITKNDDIIYIIEQKDIADIIGISKSTVNSKLKKATNFIYNDFFVETL